MKCGHMKKREFHLQSSRSSQTKQICTDDVDSEIHKETGLTELKKFCKFSFISLRWQLD